MKLRILTSFRDKETGEVYTPGSIHEFTDERAAVILADRRKVAEEYTAKKTSKPRTKKQK